ncbi:histidine kinase [Prosthecobacter sp.]|uniref:PAS domain-containing sensor histidine kinase n=1 Tax=Prosthecobacter sp. TaxID=1965333 RepID=UPI0037849CB8
MKRFLTLQFRVSALVMVFGLLMIVLNISRQYKHDVNGRFREMRLQAYEEGTRLSSFAQHFLRRRLAQSADLAISYASVNPDLRLGLISDGNDVVRNATRKQWRGLSLWDCPLPLEPHLVHQAKETSEGMMVEDLEQGRLIAFFPFMDISAASRKGLVVLQYDLSWFIASSVRHAMNEILSQACVLLGSCLLLWTLLQWLITERVALIVEQARHIGPDEVVPDPIDGGDELEIISKSIADASHRLKESEWRFRQIASHMRDIFWVAPPDTTEQIYVNRAYGEVFARAGSRLRMHRWDWLRTVVRKDRGKALKMLRALRTAPGEAEAEIRIHVRGGIEWLRCRAFSTARSHDRPGQLQVAGMASVITVEKEMSKLQIEAVENERRRIGQDLHDDVCQRLAATQLKSGVLGSSLGREGHPQAALAVNVARELAETSELARGYARGLAPVAVGPEELPDALDDLRKFLEHAFALQCRISCEDVSGVLKTEEAALIFRIAQELATNAAKHGRATWIAISLMHDHAHLRLEVANDGVSFTPGAGVKRKGMGLFMLRQRADALGATLSFQPRNVAGGGTLAVCEMPLAS